MFDCIKSVYEIRKLTDITSTAEMARKLDIPLQNFYFNLYGAYENLAMLYALKIGMIKEDDIKVEKDRKAKNISFFNVNFRKKLPQTIQEIFSIPQNFNIVNGCMLLPDKEPKTKHGYQEYFDDFLKLFRHALAHN